MKRNLLLVLIFLLLTGCSSTQQLWYNPAKTQKDFDRDSQECEIIAREFSRQATMTGKSLDYETFASAWSSCLHDKGWSNTPPADGSIASTVEELFNNR